MTIRTILSPRAMSYLLMLMASGAVEDEDVNKMSRVFSEAGLSFQNPSFESIQDPEAKERCISVILEVLAKYLREP